MSEQAPNLTPKPRRFRFTLLTLFLLVAICGWWTNRYRIASSAEEKLDAAQAGWEAQVVRTEDLCQASVELLKAEEGVPFFSRSKAATAHFERISRIKEQIDYFATCGLSGGGTPEMAKLQAEIDGLYADAKRRAGLYP